MQCPDWGVKLGFLSDVEFPSPYSDANCYQHHNLLTTLMKTSSRRTISLSFPPSLIVLLGWLSTFLKIVLSRVCILSIHERHRALEDFSAGSLQW